MNQEDFSWMERLSNAFGPSGFEEEVTAVAREYAQEFADVEEDNIRNLYIKRRSNTGDKPLIMLDGTNPRFRGPRCMYGIRKENIFQGLWQRNRYTL